MIPILALSSSPVQPTLSLSPNDAERAMQTLTRPMLTPVANVREYLAQRAAVRFFEEEQPLFITLPQAERTEVEARQAACKKIWKGMQGPRAECLYSSVHAGVVAMVRKFSHRGWTVKRFRTLFDAWDSKGDWVLLVNRSKAGALWQARESSALPDEFLTYVAQRMARARRKEAKRQAWLSIVRQWQTNRLLSGVKEPIPGYGYWQDWFKKEFPGQVVPLVPPSPRGWSEDTIYRQIKLRGKLTEAVRLMAHEGQAAARSKLPQVHMDRTKLLFMQEIQFDDVKTDFRIFDPLTGQVMDLWLLVARDVATNMVLGFGMRPARVREDGTQEHLKQRDIMQLFGWLLERYGLPPYVVTWKLENAVASVSDAQAIAIQQLLGDRVNISFASMINGVSPVGYRERGVGNTKGKPHVETGHRIGHNIRAGLPGQTGPHYGKRPADLIAREKECLAIREDSKHLPAHLQSKIQYPLLNLAQARAALWACFEIENARDDHRMQGFESVIEWLDPVDGQYKPQSTLPMKLPPGSAIRKRMETPFQRALRLREGHQWQPVSPLLITALYENSVRKVTVGDNGEILMRFEGTDYRFRQAAGGDLQDGSGKRLVPGTKLIGYFYPDDLGFLHLTTPNGSFVASWVNVKNVACGDKDGLAQALRYTTTARNAATEAARQLAAPETNELAAMRAHNAELLELGTFVEIAPSTINDQPSAINHLLGGPVGAAMTAIGQTRKELQTAKRKQVKETKDLDALVREALRNAAA